MAKVKSYDEWLIGTGEIDQLGVSLAITHRILKDNHEKLLNEVFERARDSFKNVLFDKGVHPASVSFCSNDSAGIRQVTSVIEGYQGASLEDFAGVIYGQACDFYNQTKTWEDKSLWGYFRYWIQRKWMGFSSLWQDRRVRSLTNEARSRSISCKR